MISLEGLEKIITLTGEIAIGNNIKLANLDGLINVIGANSLRITENATLKDFCGLNKLLTGSGFFGNLYINSNGYNPTLQDFLDGNCMKR